MLNVFVLSRSNERGSGGVQGQTENWDQVWAANVCIASLCNQTFLLQSGWRALADENRAFQYVLYKPLCFR